MSPIASNIESILADARGRGLAQALATPHTIVADTPRFRLRRYAGGTGRPLLIVYSLVNRPELLDLSPRRSAIAQLRTERPIYLLDWHDPEPMDRFLGLADYAVDGIGDALATVASHHDGARPHLAGVCQGGYLALCHLALNPNAAASLTTLATPVDGTTSGDTLARIVSNLDLEALAANQRNLPASELNWAFAALRPLPLLLDRYTNVPWLAGDDTAIAEFLRMEQWMYGGPSQALTAFVEFVQALYRDNALICGALRLRGEPVRLTRITTPIFNVAAAADHLVPAASAQALAGRTSGSYREMILPGGHLGVFISRRAQRKLYPALRAWLGTGEHVQAFSGEMTRCGNDNTCERRKDG